MRERLRQTTGVAEDAPVAEVIQRLHERLADAPSLVVNATLDDALAVAERPNMPGTLGEWPNWSLALPHPLGTIEQAPLPHAIAAVLRIRRDASRA
jgi:4-alpha-glucanotransferase